MSREWIRQEFFGFAEFERIFIWIFVFDILFGTVQWVGTRHEHFRLSTSAK